MGDAADKDGDGRITEEELFDALLKVDPKITRSDVASILQSIDADNDGFMDYDELLSSRIARKLQSNEDRLRKVFQLLDFDGGGTISSPSSRARSTQSTWVRSLRSRNAMRSSKSATKTVTERLISKNLSNYSEKCRHKQTAESSYYLQSIFNLSLLIFK